MGKPFAKELEKVIDTLKWGLKQKSKEIARDILYDNSDLPLYVVGSGGSLSACYFASLLYQQHGLMSKAITPLELFYSRNALRKANVLFISASGRNNDILFGYKTAVSFEPKKIYSISMRLNTPLAKLSNENSIGNHYEYELPAGKDGFLATNSLIGFFSVLFSSLGTDNRSIVDYNDVGEEDINYKINLDKFIHNVDSNYTFTILYAGWGQPVAIDLESKMAEAALANVLLSDVRNFGHGRHHWFDKRKKNAAIIALITPDEEKITEKTLSLLPDDIPVLKIYSKYTNGMASIDMLIKSFEFIKLLGESQKIDPGRPGVPDFGSKLYHLKYSSFYKTGSDFVTNEMQNAILRKTGFSSFNALSQEEQIYWTNAYLEFKTKLNSAVFDTIIFDFDGTLCSTNNRFSGIDKEVSILLNILLNKGINLGIATGRGKSVRENLQKEIDEKFWKNVWVGYYNCGDISTLNDNETPNKLKETTPALKMMFEKILAYDFPIKIDPELRPNQIVIQAKDKLQWKKIRLGIIQYIISLSVPNIQILESSHSLDVIDHSKTNKLGILDFCNGGKNNKNKTLCLGDKGKWPGNDYQLLSHEYSLSVDEVSFVKDSCWNLAKSGIKNVEATKYYLSLLEFENGLFKINI